MINRRVLLIGQAPGRGDPSRPCTGAFMRRIVAAAGISRTRYLRAFERVNLVAYWPGRSGSGDAFPAAEARVRTAEIDIRGRVVVLCGRRVAIAFGVRSPFLEPERLRGGLVYVLPHPSGRNRWWNRPENRTAAGALIRRLAEEVGGHCRCE